MDNFSKFVALYPTRNTTAKECVQALLQWIAIFGVPNDIRTDGGTQFNNHMMAQFKAMMNYHHLVVVAYHPEANGLAERRMKEVVKHLKALVFEKRIKEQWSQFLPLVQRIMNYSIDGSIGTQPARVLFGDMAGSDLAMDLPKDWNGRDIHEYLLKLREMQGLIIKATHNYLERNQRKRAREGHGIPSEVPGFREGQFVLLRYPSRPPNKLAGLYRGPLVIEAIDRPDLIKIRDLTTNKISLVHTSRLRPFRHPKSMTVAEATALAAVDMDEFYVEKIMEVNKIGKNKKNWLFRIRWLGYEPSDDTWVGWNAVKDLEALDTFAELTNDKDLRDSNKD
jgi:hypothetical protein